MFNTTEISQFLSPVSISQKLIWAKKKKKLKLTEDK